MPNAVTIRRGDAWRLWMSLAAPVVTFSGPKMISSAMRPPNMIARRLIEELARSG